jgi:5'-nucleotidase
MGKRWKLILFDLDNTLYSNEISWESGVRYALEHLNFHQQVDIDDFFCQYKLKSEGLWKMFENQELSLTDYRRKRYKETVRQYGLDCTDTEADEFQTVFSEKVMDYVEPFPRMRATLDYIVKHYQTGIVTNGPLDHQHIKIGKLTINDLFGKHNVFISGEVGVAKPHRDIFLHALNQLGAAPEETLFVGDSWEADVVGAVECGMEAIWLNSLKREPTTDHQPLAAIDSFDELLPLLQRLDGDEAGY